MVSAHKHRVLLVGSGMMTPPLVDHLCSYKDTWITVASNLPDEAKAVAARHPGQMDSRFLNIMDYAQMCEAVKGYSLVISFIPPPLHMHVLKPCLEVGVNVATSSYISPAMLEIDAQVKQKGLIFLNECGLDPGIDIMGTMKIVHEAAENDLKITSYESYCGGLPTGEQADNPLGYKFSWNPGAAIKASKNVATFMKDGKKVVTDAPLKTVEECDDVSVAFKLESYPNRDSTVFMPRFGMSDCETFIRGTYRFQGFSAIISAFHDLGLTSDEPVTDGVRTVKELAFWRFSKVNSRPADSTVSAMVDKLTQGMDHKDKQLVEGFLARTDFGYLGGDKIRIQKACTSIVQTLRFLGFFGESTALVVDKNGKRRSCLDSFGDIMADKLKMHDHDRDLVVMHHKFNLKDKAGKSFKHTSTFIQSGQSAKSGGQSIMGQTVGITCAMGARLILDGKISQRGVLSPIYKEIYQPILKDLEKFGICMIEKSERPGGLSTASNRPKM